MSCNASMNSFSSLCIIEFTNTAFIIEYLLTSRYSFEVSQYILLPQYSFIRLLIYSFDVIHTLGLYSIGIKIDAIPGRINLITTLRLLSVGECRGKCFELRGQGHLSMMIRCILNYLNLLFYIKPIYIWFKDVFIFYCLVLDSTVLLNYLDISLIHFFFIMFVILYRIYEIKGPINPVIP